MNKCRSRKGFTLAELLVAMVIASMASAVTLRSLAFSLQYYQTRSEDTSAQMLCETVSLLVQDDLTQKSAGEVDDAISNGDYKSDPEDADGYGMAPMISGVTLPNACYGFGNTTAQSRKVKISVSSVSGEDYYKVTVSVIGGSGVMAAKNEFTVTPLG